MPSGMLPLIEQLNKLISLMSANASQASFFAGSLKPGSLPLKSAIDPPDLRDEIFFMIGGVNVPPRWFIERFRCSKAGMPSVPNTPSAYIQEMRKKVGELEKESALEKLLLLCQTNHPISIAHTRTWQHAREAVVRQVEALKRVQLAQRQRQLAVQVVPREIQHGESCHIREIVGDHADQVV